MMQFDLGRLGVWGHLDSLAAPEAIAYARRAEELGYGTLWVPETVGREPIALLSLLAGATDAINLGTSIVNIWGRDAQAARMAALTIAEASGGRFVLGLGVSHPHLAGKLRGHQFERPLSRMRDYLAAYRAAVYRGPLVDGASEPPVLVAALRERMVDLAATDADGALPYLVTAERVAWMRGRLDAAAGGARPRLAVTLPAVIGDAGDRDAARAYLRPYLRTPTYQASWLLQGFDGSDWEPPGSHRLVDAMVAVGPVDLVRERIGAMMDAGADHVAIIPLAPDGTTEHAPTLEQLAR
ncbi:MAG TPA: LLM class flavin-dependent oxidoreductase [Candidatus Limnocylindrales bacterium]|nr:LLM class flavin-dependent oxidoreductase [Candidatus Limnocylindrales bacterium]